MKQERSSFLPATKRPFRGFSERWSGREKILGNDGRIRRIVLIGVSALVLLYFGGAAAGYVWVRHFRKSEHVTFLDIALLRWKEVRRGLAIQQFARAKLEREAGNHQAAFLAYTFAVNNDPDNVAGRLSAVDFISSIGSSAMAIDMLETGLRRAPDNPELIERTFGLLSANGRDQRTLELLSRRPSDAADPATALKLYIYELQALLNLGEVQRAKTLVQKHPQLIEHPAAAPIYSRLLWETKERIRAMEVLSAHLKNGSPALSSYTQLAQWQLTLTLTEEAVDTAEQACARFPDDIAARVGLIDAIAMRSFQGREALPAIEKYLREFGDRPQAIIQLGTLAARRGWVELARSIYEYSASQQQNMSLFAFFYSDALMQKTRYREARDVLSEIEEQAVDGAGPLLVQLRHRQVIVAAALADSANVREYARRLAAILRNDPAGFEASQRHFKRIPIPDAVAEFDLGSTVLAKTR